MQKERLSLIIPTRARVSLIPPLIRKIQQQTLSVDEFECLIVDNSPNSELEDKIYELSHMMPNLRYISERSPGLHNARHAGYRASSYRILVFADDDIVPAPFWLEGIRGAFRSSSVGIVVGRTLPKYLVSPPSWLEELFVRNEYGIYSDALSLYDGGEFTKEIPADLAYGCNFAIRRQCLEMGGGFEPDGMPEDLRIYRGGGETSLARQVQAARFKVIYEPSATVFHLVPESRMKLSYIFKRSRNGGIGSSFIQIRKCGQTYLAFYLCLSGASLSLHLLKILTRAGRIAFIRRLGHWIGFFEHQISFCKNPRLRAWVQRRDFFDTCEP